MLLQLLVDLGEREEADVRGVFLVPRHFQDGVFVAGDVHSAFFHRPVEQPAEDFAVAVGGFRGEAAALQLAGDEGGDLQRRDLLEAIGLDDQRPAAEILLGTGKQGALLGGLGQSPAGHLQLRADGAERLAEIVHVRLGALGRLAGADVVDVPANDIRDRRAAWQRGISALSLGGFKLPKLFLRQLVIIGAGRSPAGFARDTDLNVVRSVALNETRHSNLRGALK